MHGTHHHPVLWDETTVLDEATNNTTLLIKESLHIHLADTEKLLNRDEGVDISDCWSTIWSPAHRMRVVRQAPLTSNGVTTDPEARRRSEAHL